jgi:glycogen phosphorylase
VIPQFYDRDEEGIPTTRVRRMRESMARLTPQFSTNRMAREYTEQYYLPAAATYRKRAAGNGEIGADIVNWRRSQGDRWNAFRFGEVKCEANGEQPCGPEFCFIFAPSMGCDEQNNPGLRSESHPRHQ